MHGKEAESNTRPCTTRTPVHTNIEDASTHPQQTHREVLAQPAARGDNHSARAHFIAAHRSINLGLSSPKASHRGVAESTEQRNEANRIVSRVTNESGKGSR